MSNFIEIINEFENSVCYHEVILHESIDQCIYGHYIIKKCSSDDYKELENTDVDNMSDLFEVESDKHWLVFRFYECNVEQAFAFETESEAKEKFDEESSQLTYYDSEVKLTDLNDQGTRTCGIYYKSRGKYNIPDKFTRIVMVKLSEFEEKIEV